MHTYSQSTGEWRHDGDLVGAGYSGFGSGLNNPEMQNVLDVGPIPAGVYTIGAPEDLAGGPHGPFVMRLKPDAVTATRVAALGRDPYSFLCHGPKIGENDPHKGTASHGCICMLLTFRQAISRWVASGDDQLSVIA